MIKILIVIVLFQVALLPPCPSHLGCTVREDSMEEHVMKLAASTDKVQDMQGLGAVLHLPTALLTTPSLHLLYLARTDGWLVA